MGISRFENFKPVDFNDMALNAPDTEGLDQLLGQFQSEYDTGIAKLNEANFKNLSKDDIRSRELRKEQYQMVDDIANQYVGSVAEGRRSMAQGLTDLSRDYKEGGERYQIGANREAFMAAREENKKRIGKGEAAGGITEDQMRNWEKYTLNNYEGAKADDFGIYGGINMDEVAGHVNINLRAEEIAKTWQPDKVKTGVWVEREDGNLWRKTTKGSEIVPEEEILQEVTAALGRDGQLTNYLNQYAKHTGQPIDLDNIGEYVSKDDFQYNRANPLVQAALTVAKKWGRKDTLYDQDINLSLLKQKRGFVNADRVKKEEFMMDNVITMDNTDTVLTDLATTTQVKETLDGISDNISKTKEFLKDLTIPVFEREQYETRLASMELQRDNIRLLEQEMLESAPPEYKESVNAINGLSEHAGLTRNVEQKSMEAALAALTTTTKSFGKDGHSKKVTQEPLTGDNIDRATKAYQEYANSHGGSLSYTDAEGLVLLNDNKMLHQAKADKAMNKHLEDNTGKYQRAQPQISIDARDYNGTKAGGKETPFNNVTRDLKESPDNFVFHSAVTGDMGSGQSFYDQLQEDYPDDEILFNTIKMHKFQPSNTFYSRGKTWDAQDGGLATIQTKGGRTIQLNFGFKKGVADNHAQAIKDYYMEYGSDNVKELLAKQQAREEHPGQSLDRLISGKQYNHVIELYPQKQDGPDALAGKQAEVIRVKAKDNNPETDTYKLKFGGLTVDFKTSDALVKYANQVKKWTLQVENMSNSNAIEHITNKGVDVKIATALINYIK